jgi:putative MATE family efflux protein
MESDPRADRLGTEPLGRLIVQFSLPVVAQLVVNALYNLVDRVFVGRGVGPDALAGITISFPFFILVSAVGTLFGQGAAAVISLRLGRKDRAGAGACASVALAASAAAAVLVAGAGLLLLRPMLILLGGTGEVLAQAERFTAIALVGALFQMVAIPLGMIIRSAGAPAVTLRIALIGTVVNLALNPLFIFGLRLGVAGSALATCLAELSSCLLGVAHFRRHGRVLALRRPRRADLPALGDSLALGAAPFCMQLALALMIAISNQAVAAHGGRDGVAVMGILYVVYPLILLPLAGLTCGVQPVLGFNYGAGALDRVRRALGLAVAAGSAFCTAAWVPILLLAGPIVRLFVGHDPGVGVLGPPALRTFFALLPLVGLQVVGASYFQAVGKAVTSLLNNMLRQVIILVPLLLVLPRVLGLDGVWLANPISDAASAAITGGFVLVEMRRLVERCRAAPVPLPARAA